jgi:endoglucanase
LVYVIAGAACASTPEGGAPKPQTPSAAPPLGTMSPGTSSAEGNNLLVNAGFEEGTMLPWSVDVSSPAAGDGSVESGELCLKIKNAGKETYDVVLRQRPLRLEAGHKYQVRFKARSTAATRVRAKIAQTSSPYTERWSAIVPLSSQAQTFAGSFTPADADANVELAIHLGGELAGSAPLTVCFDDLEINDPKFEIPAERTAKPPPAVRVNQIGYFPDREKIATYKSKSPDATEWQLVDAGGKVVASGKTKPFGEDRAAGELVQQIDFSSFKTAGNGLKLVVGKDDSPPFDIRDDLYKKLKYDALAFFYHQRSGVPIAMPFSGDAQHARPAGHPGDKSIACHPDAKCSYSLDVSGGWYDAGDHGKYVVNGGISLWLLQNLYERAKYLGHDESDFGDGKMAIPENANGKPDLLDEARFEMEWMMRMQVPAGNPLAGMVHHAVHDDSWSPIPTRPDQDHLPRHLRPVSTTATLNLAATAAQAARLWKALDPAFSKRCLEVAESAWQAAKKNPAIAAVGAKEGGGAYGDPDPDDEFFWAGVELFVTTGRPEYKKDFEARTHIKTFTTTAAGASASMAWDHVAALGTITLATVPSALDKAAVAEQRKLIVAAADTYLRFMEKRAYRVPLESDSKYPWGSNSFILDDMVVMGLAYDFTHDKKYVRGVVESMDYLLGHNPKAQSYVSGYGSRPLHNPHHRFWAHQKDPSLPSVPPGVVSGGPNSGIEDPYAKQVGLGGCAPQVCYVDHIESWSTNEIAINWNAPLAWAVAFLDDVVRGRH